MSGDRDPIETAMLIYDVDRHRMLSVMWVAIGLIAIVPLFISGAFNPVSATCGIIDSLFAGHHLTSYFNKKAEFEEVKDGQRHNAR